MNVRRLLSALLGVGLLLGLTTVATASAAPVALDRFLAADTELVELKNGRGKAVLRVRGGMNGHLRRGTLRLVDLPAGAKTRIGVYGAEWVRRVSDRVAVYGGRDLTFYAFKGWWKAQIKGRGIDVGAAARGRLTLSGRTGTYWIGDGEWKPWPQEPTTFRLSP